MKHLGNQGGFLTSDFLFALTLSLSMSAIVFGICYSLVAFQATQYVVFAASRAQSAGDVSPETQAQLARAKYNSLISSGSLNILYNGGWFEVSSAADVDIRSGNGSNFNNDYPDSVARAINQGVRTTLFARLLELRLPFVGRIESEDGDGFSVRVVSMLIREPSMEECVQFSKDRVQAIWNLRGTQWSTFNRNGAIETPWEDNGC